jgi:hypothetical protein
MSSDWSEMRELDGRGFLVDTRATSRDWLEPYIHPDDQPRVLRAINEAVTAKTMFELEHRVLRGDGTLDWTLSRAVPILDSAGEIVEWFGAASDVTGRKEAELPVTEELRAAGSRAKRQSSSTGTADGPRQPRARSERCLASRFIFGRRSGWSAEARPAHRAARSRGAPPVYASRSGMNAG